MKDTFKRWLGFESQQIDRPKRDYWGEQRYLEKQEFKYILWLDRIYEKIQNTPGHIVELGVAYGRNAILFSHFIDMHNESDIRQYFGFDTFDGYTESTLASEKNLSGSNWKNIDTESVKDRVSMSKTRTKVHLKQGDIIETIPRFLKNNPNFKAALVYVDCNAYEPAIAALRALRPHLMPGAIVCMDEKKQGGETKALLEFCSENELDLVKDKSPFSIPAYTRIN